MRGPTPALLPPPTHAPVELYERERELGLARRDVRAAQLRLAYARDSRQHLERLDGLLLGEAAAARQAVVALTMGGERKAGVSPLHAGSLPSVDRRTCSSAAACGWVGAGSATAAATAAAPPPPPRRGDLAGGEDGGDGTWCWWCACVAAPPLSLCRRSVSGGVCEKSSSSAAAMAERVERRCL